MTPGMSAILGPVIAGVVGVVVAVGASFGVVAAKEATPKPVNQPYVVYGSSSASGSPAASSSPTTP